MALDVFEAESDRPIWHGIASARIGSTDSPSNALIQSAVDGLDDRFAAASGRQGM